MSEYYEGMRRYYVLNKGNGIIFVKEGDFFESQGGLQSKWGKNWEIIWADSIEHARDKCRLLELERK